MTISEWQITKLCALLLFSECQPKRIPIHCQVTPSLWEFTQRKVSVSLLYINTGLPRGTLGWFSLGTCGLACWLASLHSVECQRTFIFPWSPCLLMKIFSSGDPGMWQVLESKVEMSNTAAAKSQPGRKKNYFFFHKAMQEVIYLDPFSPIKPWEASGRSGKAELSLQEIKHEMKTSSSYSALSSQSPVSHSRPLIKWCPVSVLKDEFWLCSYI